MTYYVNQACIMCKHTDCVEVCPVDCFYEGENFLAINPDECIDCGVCEPECPVDAIKPDSHEEPDKQKYLDINKKYSSGDERWPVITAMIDQHAEAEKYNPDVWTEDKTELLSEKPAGRDE